MGKGSWCRTYYSERGRESFDRIFSGGGDRCVPAECGSCPMGCVWDGCMFDSDSRPCYRQVDLFDGDVE
jgi:hypothetical protein